MKTDELEKKISEEFEKLWQSDKGRGFDTASMRVGFKYAYLPLMKKIEELVSSKEEWIDKYISKETQSYELQKENGELREALDWATRLLENLDDYEDNAQFYRAKFNLI